RRQARALRGAGAGVRGDRDVPAVPARTAQGPEADLTLAPCASSGPSARTCTDSGWGHWPQGQLSSLVSGWICRRGKLRCFGAGLALRSAMTRVLLLGFVLVATACGGKTFE